MREKVKEFSLKHINTIKNIGMMSVATIVFIFGGVAGLRLILGENECNELIKL